MPEPLYKYVLAIVLNYAFSVGFCVGTIKHVIAIVLNYAFCVGFMLH